MLKRLAVVAFAVAFAAGSVFADAKNGGVAREIAMGGATIGSSGVLNPFIFNDPSYVLVNPAYAASYKDYTWMNIGGGTLNGLSTADNGYGRQSGAVNFGFGKELSIGAILSYDPSLVSTLRPQLNAFITGVDGAHVNPLATPAPVDVFEVLATYSAGGFDFGFAILYGWSKNDGTQTVGGVTTSAELPSSVFGLRAGIDLDLGGGSRFEASGAVRFDKVSDKIVGPAAVGTSEYSLSATEIQVVARLRMKVSNRVAFIPYGLFFSASGDPKQDALRVGQTATTVSVKGSTLAIALGAGAEYKVSNFLFAGGVSWATQKQKVESSGGAGTNTQTQTTTMSAIPVFNLGMEWWFVDWLAGRMGYFRAFTNTNDKTENTLPVSSTETNTFLGVSNVAFGGYNMDNLVTLGLGFRFGNFGLDATVSEEALRRGLGLIGAQDNINSFGYLTASYNFE